MKKGQFSVTQIKDQIDNAIANFCIKIIHEPLSYFSEGDCQQYLVEELRRIKELQRPYDMAVPRGEGSKGHYSTTLVHREYGGGGGTRIDVVVFHPDDVAKIETPDLKVGNRYLPPLFAFELGTEKTLNTAKHLERDFNRLQKAQNTGYIIHFFRDVTVSKTGSESRDRTEARIERVFKQVFAKQRSQGNGKVKVLPILLRIGRAQKRMIGKCEIFDGTKWLKVNVGSQYTEQLRAKILKQLQ